MLNQIFRFAKRKGYISDPPVIAIPSSRQNSRPDISETEWRTLYTYLRKYVKEAQDKRRYRERFCLQHYILILANSGIRIGEARHLRWRDNIKHQNTERSEATDLYSSRQDRRAGGCL